MHNMKLISVPLLHRRVRTCPQPRVPCWRVLVMTIWSPTTAACLRTSTLKTCLLSPVWPGAGPTCRKPKTSTSPWACFLSCAQPTLWQFGFCWCVVGGYVDVVLGLSKRQDRQHETDSPRLCFTESKGVPCRGFPGLYTAGQTWPA